MKGLNTVVAEVMVDPTLSGGDPDMFIAGDDDRAKRTITALLEDFSTGLSSGTLLIGGPRRRPYGVYGSGSSGFA